VITDSGVFDDPRLTAMGLLAETHAGLQAKFMPALTAAGLSCPRDSDMQEQALGAPIGTAADFADVQRGDVIFWKGHVAIVRDGASLIHANAFHMAVAIEPIAEAIARIRAAGSDITSMRRVARSVA